MTIGIIIGIVVILFFFFDRNSKRKMKERFDEYQYNKPPPDVDEIKRNLGFNISEKFNDDNLDDYNPKRLISIEDESDKEYYKVQNDRWIKNYQYGKNKLEESLGDLNGKKCSDILNHISKIFEHGRDIDTPELHWTIDIIEHYGMTQRRFDLMMDGGKRWVSTDKGYEEISNEGIHSEFRREVCESEEIITSEEIRQFYDVYNQEYQETTERISTGGKVIEVKRMIKSLVDGIVKTKKNDKDFNEPFDIQGYFLSVRGLMIGTSNGDTITPYPFEWYVWNLISGNPFDRVWRISRDYTKWKGTKRVSSVLFNNVKNWENGEIFREGEPLKPHEKPLWVNWNTIGKSLLTLKTKLKKEDKGGLDWLKNEVGSYIKERKSFYDDFGKESEYYISDELISKFENLK
jgi:hypothetical protein